MSDVHLVVMAGGSGTRFWPKSTSKKPKQLLGFNSDRTLLQQTLDRFEGWVPESAQWIVTTQSLQSAVAEGSPRVNVLAEPQGRNTAPCVYWAARAIAEKNPRAVMLVMPADHYIPRVDHFIKTVKAAAQWAVEKGDLVTLGVKPTRPETGYGYLHLGEKRGGDCVQVQAFVEKPNAAKAEEFVSSGQYLWNGGMFVWRVDSILEAFDRFMPEMKQIWDQAGGQILTAYPKMTATSIDYGVMEKARNVVTFPLDCGWDDVGSWTSLETLAAVWGKMQAGSAVLSGELVPVESSGLVVDVPKDRLVATLGVDDLIIVESGKTILVAHKSRAQDIRKVVDAVKARRPELT